MAHLNYLTRGFERRRPFGLVADIKWRRDRFCQSPAFFYPFVWNSDCSLEVRRRWLQQENISEIGLDVDCIEAGSGVMAKWTSAIDSPYQVVLITFLTDF